MRSGPISDPPGASDLEADLLLLSRTDPEAFGTFYDRTHRMVLGFFLTRTACAATSADLCSETFAGALANVDRFEPSKGTGRGWLTGIARHVLQQYLRREKVATRARQRLGIRLVVDEHLDLERIEALVDFRPRVARLAATLHVLPDDTRKAVLMRIVDQLPYEEIAERLGCSVGHARVRVCRGLDRLETLLEAP